MRDYKELARRFDSEGASGQDVETWHGDDAAAKMLELLEPVTGAQTLDGAYRVSRGRPGLNREGGRSRTWKTRVPDALDERAHAYSDRVGLPLSEIVRRAMDDYLNRASA